MPPPDKFIPAAFDKRHLTLVPAITALGERAETTGGGHYVNVQVLGRYQWVQGIIGVETGS